MKEEEEGYMCVGGFGWGGGSLLECRVRWVVDGNWWRDEGDKLTSNCTKTYVKPWFK